MSVAEFVWMALQVLLVSGIAFVVLCAITSVVRFQQRTRDLVELPRGQPSGMDGFRVLVASVLGVGRKEPSPMAVGMAEVEGVPAEDAEAEVFRRDVAERLGARLRETDMVRWIDDRRLGVLVIAPLPRMEAVLNRWLDGARQDLAGIRFGVSLVPLHGVSAESLIEAAARALETVPAGSASPPAWAQGGPPAAEDATPRPTPENPLAGVAEDQRHLADPTTGLLLAKHLPTMFQKRLAAARREGEAVSVLCLEIQHLARYRDHFGVEGVEAILAHAGTCLQGAVRETDLPSRAEDDVLVVVLGCSAQRALEVAARLSAAMCGLSIAVGDAEVRIGLCGGVAGYPDHGRAARGLLERARLAMAAARVEAPTGCRIYQEEMGMPDSAPVSTETF